MRRRSGTVGERSGRPASAPADTWLPVVSWLPRCWPAQRDRLTTTSTLCLLAGYSAVSERVQKDEGSHWLVLYSTADTAARPILTINPTTAQQPQHVRSLPNSPLIPVWCISVPTHRAPPHRPPHFPRLLLLPPAAGGQLVHQRGGEVAADRDEHGRAE